MVSHYQRGSSQWISLFSVLLLGTMMVLVGSMVRYGPWPKKSNSRREIPLFSYEKETIQAQVQRLTEENTHWIEQVTFPSSMAPYWVTTYYYVQKRGIKGNYSYPHYGISLCGSSIRSMNISSLRPSKTISESSSNPGGTITSTIPFRGSMVLSTPSPS